MYDYSDVTMIHLGTIWNRSSFQPHSIFFASAFLIRRLFDSSALLHIRTYPQLQTNLNRDSMADKD